VWQTSRGEEDAMAVITDRNPDSGAASRTTSPREKRRVAKVERSLERLRAARDDGCTAITVPTAAPERQWLTTCSVWPAVDPPLWTRHVRYARRRDQEALNSLVEHYRPHTEALARSHYRHGEPLEDLTQIAFEGLMVALQRFDPERRRPFLAFARPTITGMIRRHFRDAGWSIKIPRRVHDLSGPIRESREMLTQDLGREPSNAEIADLVGVSENEIRDVLSAEDVRRTDSLDIVDPVTKLQAEQVIGQADTGLAWIENRTALNQALELLSADDRELLYQYFIKERTQTEIAKDLGCSQMQVSRLLASALRRLRRRIVG
jgi:RNA polymerase sigma-B factor